MGTKERPKITAKTMNKNTLFLNTAIKEIKNGSLKITALIETMGVDRSLFYIAFKLGYFTRHHITKNKFEYQPTVESFSYEDVYRITLETNNQQAEYREKYKLEALQKKNTEMNNQPFVNTNYKNNPVTTKLLGSPIVEPLPPIKFTHLQSETDEDLIAELKRRGYEGTITIKKQVTL